MPAPAMWMHGPLMPFNDGFPRGYGSCKRRVFWMPRAPVGMGQRMPRQFRVRGTVQRTRRILAPPVLGAGGISQENTLTRWPMKRSIEGECGPHRGNACGNNRVVQPEALPGCADARPLFVALRIAEFPCRWPRANYRRGFNKDAKFARAVRTVNSQPRSKRKIAFLKRWAGLFASRDGMRTLDGDGYAATGSKPTQGVAGLGLMVGTPLATGKNLRIMGRAGSGPCGPL